MVDFFSNFFYFFLKIIINSLIFNKNRALFFYVLRISVLKLQVFDGFGVVDKLL